MSANSKQQKKQTLMVSPKVEWALGEKAFQDLNKVLSDEITYLTIDVEIRNAYSPIAWARLCLGIRHLTQGMATIRLHCEGKTNKEIEAQTGVDVRRIAAFKAWNTQYKKSIHRALTIRGRNKEQRKADLKFLRSIGVSIVDEGQQ
jgi:hypothetical protein